MTEKKNWLQRFNGDIADENIEVIYCQESSTGEQFLQRHAGAELSDITVLRMEDFDLVALTTTDNQKIAIVADKDSFIAVELKDQVEGASGNLAFRPDISHSRIDLLSSFATGVDVTYQDDSLVNGETLDLDPAAHLSRLMLSNQAVISRIRPSKWTEDWLTVYLEDDRRIIIRSDRNHILGVVSVGQEAIGFMNIGDNRIQDIDYKSALISTIPAKFLSE